MQIALYLPLLNTVGIGGATKKTLQILVGRQKPQKYYNLTRFSMEKGILQ